ncbi:Thioredoxin-like fold [Russula decolorans]
MSTPQEIVDKAVAENTVVVFSKSWCPYSKKAKALLKEKYSDAQTAIFELDEREDGGELQNYLQEKTNQRTVPNIFIKQQHIGGAPLSYLLGNYRS